jgi:hypothetical protein
VVLKIAPKAGYEFTLEKSTSESEGKPEQKFEGAFRTTFRISNCFQRNKQTLNIYFSHRQGRLKILKLFAHVQKVLI